MARNNHKGPLAAALEKSEGVLIKNLSKTVRI